MSFTHKIVGKIIGDRKSKNYEGIRPCVKCGKETKSNLTETEYAEQDSLCSKCYKNNY